MPPAEIRALIEAGTAQDSENALVAFFGRLAFETYRAALTAEEATTLAAATLFTEAVPVPTAAIVAAAQALGVEDPAPPVARLQGLGLLDDWGDSPDTPGDAPHAAANPLARPLAPRIDPADRPRAARAALPVLAAAWTDADGDFPRDARAVCAAETALAAEQADAVLAAAATAAARHLFDDLHDTRAAHDLARAALDALQAADSTPPAGLLMVAIDCAERLTEMDTLKADLAAGTTAMSARTFEGASLRLRAARLAEIEGRPDAALAEADAAIRIFAEDGGLLFRSGLGLRRVGLGRDGRRRGVGQAFVGGRRGLAELVHQAPEMRRLDHVETPRAILGRIAPRVERLADEAALHGAVLGLEGGSFFRRDFLAR